MTEQCEIYRCNVCSNIVMVMHGGAGELVCCGELMEKLEEKTQEEMFEKHLPVIKENGEKYIQVGETRHPMTQEHHIQWIEVQTDNQKMIKFLDIESEPVFMIKSNEKILSAREYCNIHGLWKGSYHE